MSYAGRVNCTMKSGSRWFKVEVPTSKLENAKLFCETVCHGFLQRAVGEMGFYEHPRCDDAKLWGIDDPSMYHFVSGTVYAAGRRSLVIKVPNVKKTISDDELGAAIRSFCDVQGAKIELIYTKRKAAIL